MYIVETRNSFKKDYKLALKRGLNSKLINEVILLLEKDGKLPPKCKAHILKGNYIGLWECHIQPN